MSHIFDYRVCPTIGAINIDIKLISQIPTLPHYIPHSEEGGVGVVLGHNVDRCIILTLQLDC